MPDQSININVATLPSYACRHCSFIYFKKITKLRYLKPFTAGNPKAMIIAEELYICDDCHHLVAQEDLDAFKPNQIFPDDKD